MAGSGLRGEVQPPGVKSISHRALILAALARGTSRIAGLNPGLTESEVEFWMRGI